MFNPTPAMAAWFGYPYGLCDRLRLVKGAGFKSVLLWWDDNESYELPIPKKCEAARREGLEIENAHLPYSDMNSMWLPGEDGEYYAAMLCRLVEDAKVYGVPTLVLHLTRKRTPPPMSDIGISRFMRVVETAERVGVNIAFENLKAFERLYEFMPLVDSKRVGVCFDSGHNNVYCPERRVAVDFSDRIIAVHLHDNDGFNDTHLLPFDGTNDWARTKRELIASSYSGVWSLEIEYDKGGIFSSKKAKYAPEVYSKLSVEEYLSRAMERLQKLFALPVS